MHVTPFAGDREETSLRGASALTQRAEGYTRRPGSNERVGKMTQVCCPSCRLRFTRAAAAYLVACPDCGEPPQPVVRAEDILGFRLVSDDDRSDSLPVALAIALARPTSDERSP